MAYKCATKPALIVIIPENFVAKR